MEFATKSYRKVFGRWKFSSHSKYQVSWIITFLLVNLIALQTFSASCWSLDFVRDILGFIIFISFLPNYTDLYVLHPKLLLLNWEWKLWKTVSTPISKITADPHPPHNKHKLENAEKEKYENVYISLFLCCTFISLCKLITLLNISCWLWVCHIKENQENTFSVSSK